MSESEIIIERKNSQPGECIICLDEFVDNNYHKLPNENSLCKCVYEIHNECLERCENKCPICRMQIKEEITENISNRENENIILCRIGMVIFMLCAISFVIFIYFFYIF